jgi:uncharacterized protein with ATP-grasp and redox domains
MHRAFDVLRVLDVRHSPPHMARQLHRVVRGLLGSDDPYREIKDTADRRGVAARERLRPMVEQARDPFGAALRVSIAANTIGGVMRGDVSDEVIVHALIRALRRRVHGSPAATRRAAAKASRVLLLADDAGELALDCLLLERLRPAHVVVAVRGAPVVDDATRADAEAVGVSEWAEVIDNGSDAPGTLLEDCSPQFRREFARADLVLAKGAGNFESLAHLADPRIAFLLVPKCPIVARHVGAPEGAPVAWKLARRRSRAQARH